MIADLPVEPAASADSRPEGRQSLSRRQTMAIVGGLMLGVLLAALDGTIVSAAIRTIADDLQGLSLQAWATTAYLITSTLSTPLYGKLADIYGRKLMYLTSIMVFLVGSIACTVSTSMLELAVFRAVQGAGTGGLISLALVITADIASPRQAAKYQSAFIAMFSLCSLVGPVVGGFLAAQASIAGIAGWRWVFLVNIPVGAVALAVIAKVLHGTHNRVRHRIDWLGTVTIGAAVVPVLLVSSEGQVWGWGSANAVACYAIAVVGLVAFFLVERKMKDAALIPLKLFRSRTFSLSVVLMLVVGAGMFGAMGLLPQYFQLVKGMSPTAAGLLMLPAMLGLTVSSTLSAQLIARTGRYKIFPLLGIALIGAAMVMFCRIGVDTPLVEVEVYLVIFGLGLGMTTQPLTLAAQNAVSAADVGVATSSATFFQQMGGTVGTSVLVSAMFSGVVGAIGEAFRASLGKPEFQAVLRDPVVLRSQVNDGLAGAVRDGSIDSYAGRVLTDSSFIQQLDPRLARPFLQGFSSSITTGFLIGLVVMVVGLVLVAFLKERPLAAAAGVELDAISADDAGIEVAAVAVTGPIPRISAFGAGSIDVTAPIPRVVWPRLDPEPRADVVARPVVAGGYGAFSWFRSPQPGGMVIHGVVVRSGGAPVPDVTLTLIDLAGLRVAQYCTDSSGHFGLAAPARGTYLVVASAAGYQSRALMVPVSGRAICLNVALTGASRLVGTVRWAGGDGVPLAMVTLVNKSGRQLGAVTTGPDGRYSFAELTPGDYRVEVRAGRHDPVRSNVAVAANAESRCDLTVDGVVHVRGTVRAEGDSHPISHARITILDTAGNAVRSVATDGDGKYAFGELPEGEYTMVVDSFQPLSKVVRINRGEHFVHDLRLDYDQPSGRHARRVSDAAS